MELIIKEKVIENMLYPSVILAIFLLKLESLFFLLGLSFDFLFFFLLEFLPL